MMTDVTQPADGTQARKPMLRLWLPGYHTPSLNVTTGAGMRKGRGSCSHKARMTNE